ncbi:MAG: sulfotransferase family protein [Planctomycetota bacterium]|jgi:hypothetical protein
MNVTQFTGPVFILGLPRSGTTLLRDLLNRSPEISIVVYETWFFPYMIKKFGYDIDLNQSSCMKEFYYEFINTAFYDRMRDKGCCIAVNDLENIEDKQSWASIFEFLLRFFTPEKGGTNFICGDKTPGYTHHIGLLHKVFPESRFIHIIRDPRDCALSTIKFRRKSIYRAAARWSESIGECRRKVKSKNIQYLELYYEDLLENPQKVLKNICDFLGCSFSEDMLSLERPSESMGDAKGQTRIATNNREKYVEQLSVVDIKRIEEITLPVLRDTPYKVHFAQRHRPLNSLFMKLLRLYDGCALLTYNMRDKGMVKGVKLFYTIHKRK